MNREFLELLMEIQRHAELNFADLNSTVDGIEKIVRLPDAKYFVETMADLLNAYWTAHGDTHKKVSEIEDKIRQLSAITFQGDQSCSHIL